MNKKILIVATNANSLINFRYELIKSLITANFVVIACAPEDAYWSKVAKELSLINVRLFKVKINNTSLNVFKDLVGLIALYNLLKQESPTYVFNYSIKSIIYSSCIARFYGIKNIYSMITGLGYAFSAQGFKQKFIVNVAKILYKISLKANKKVFFQNRDDINLFVNNGLVGADQVVLINGSGVNIDFFQCVPPPKSISFLFVGRFLKDKGIYEYFNAAKKLKQKYPDVIFKILGEISPNPSSITHDELEIWEKTSVIKNLGYLTDVRPALHDAAVFVLPSYREGIPRSGLEALSVGRAIITTDAPGCKEIVHENYNGYLVSVKNHVELAGAMEKFILEPKLVVSMGINSRQLAMQKFNVHEINKIIISQIT